jgi:NADPH:quinone reductase-like Zn-dependent oxidoreductase
MTSPALVDTSLTGALVPTPAPMPVAAAPQRAVVLTRFGGPEGFEVRDDPMPVPGPGEVRVRVLAASVQFTDTLLRRGKYPDLHQKPPLVLGYDVVGEVDEVGPGVSSFKRGDRVADLTMCGSYARYRLLRASQLVRVPRGLDAAEVVALVLSWVTAYQLLHREARVISGQRVLIHGAAGAVGQALISLGKLAGLKLWGTARATDEAFVRGEGATPIDTAGDGDRTLVREGFDVVFDGIGERGFSRAFGCVRPGGTLLAYGFSAGVAQGAGPLSLAWWLLRLKAWNALSGSSARFYSITALRKAHPEWYRADLEKLLKLLDEGRILPRVAERIGLDDVAAAHRRLEAGGLKGKIVLCP